MEILLIAACVGTYLLVVNLKTTLSDRWKLIVSALAGAFLLIWFWGTPDVLLYWKIIVTVVVISSVQKLFRRIKDNNIQTKESQS